MEVDQESVPALDDGRLSSSYSRRVARLGSGGIGFELF